MSCKTIRAETAPPQGGHAVGRGRVAGRSQNEYTHTSVSLFLLGSTIVNLCQMPCCLINHLICSIRISQAQSKDTSSLCDTYYDDCYQVGVPHNHLYGLEWDTVGLPKTHQSSYSIMRKLFYWCNFCFTQHHMALNHKIMESRLDEL